MNTLTFIPARKAPSLQRRGGHARGFAFIEVLVASLVFSFGVLGIVGLQARMSSAQTHASMRLTAINLTQELIGSMWADISAGGLNRFSTGSCSADPRCSAWKTKVQRELPNGVPTVEIVGNTANIQLAWSTKDGQQTYRTFTAVQP